MPKTVVGPKTSRLISNVSLVGWFFNILYTFQHFVALKNSSVLKNFVNYLRETLFKTEDEIEAETLALHFFATEIGHKNVQILLKLAETLASGLHVFMKEILQEGRARSFFQFF